jgi:predicted acyltransferase (DUF342 family)
VFKSKNGENTNDYGYIQYEENGGGGTAVNDAEKGVMVIGIENNAGDVRNDSISLYASGGNGRIGVNTKFPTYNLDVSGNTLIRNKLFVSNDVSLNSKLFVTNDVSLNSRLTVSLDASLNSKLFVSNDVSLNSRLTVTNDVSLNSRLTVSLDASLNSKLFVTNDVSLNSRLTVSLDTSLNSKLFVSNDVSLNSKLFVGGDVSLNGNLYVVNRSVFTLDVSMIGNLDIGSGLSCVAINKDISSNFALDVSGETKIRGNLDVSGVFTVNGAPVSGGGTLTGNVQVGSNSGFVTIDKPQFYSDPSLTIYYDFDTSYNVGKRIYNYGNLGSAYDASISSTSGLIIDTTQKKNGLASLKNNGIGITICNNNTNNLFPVSSTMTFSLWIYKPDTPATNDFDRIFEISDLIASNTNNTEGNTIALDISSSGIVLPVLTSSTTSCFTPSNPIFNYNVCNGAWNNIVWQITSTRSILYINGSNAQIDTITTPVPTGSRKTAFIANAFNLTNNRDFSGNIDDFRYYKDKALNYAEIYQLSTNNFYTLDICGGFLANGPSVIYEPSGSVATANRGTLTLLHGDTGGSSSIMFKSNTGQGDYAYIEYYDNVYGVQSLYKWNLSPSTGATYHANDTVDTSVGLNKSVRLAIGSTSPSFFFVEAPTPSTFPSNTYCISFNQTNQTGSGNPNSISYLSSGYIGAMQKITISLWIRPNITYGIDATYAYYIANFSNSSIIGVIDMYIRSDKKLLVLINNDSTNCKVSNSLIQDNVWTHVAFTFSPNDGYIYINGVKNEVTQGTGYTTFSALNTINNLLLGMKYGYNDGNDNRKGFRGYMNFINVFNTNLTDADILYLYNNPSYSSTTDRGLMTIGIENDGGYINNDRIALWPKNGTGFVGINTKTPQATLDVSGSLNIGGNVKIYGDVEAVSYNAISDYRMKENVVPLDDSFTIDGLNPVTYNLKSSCKKDIGFIAHEVQEFYTFLVSGEKDGKETQSLNYNGFIGILTKEIKVLKKKVAEQEAKALEQDQRIQALEKMIFDLINNK